MPTPLTSNLTAIHWNGSAWLLGQSTGGGSGYLAGAQIIRTTDLAHYFGYNAGFTGAFTITGIYSDGAGNCVAVTLDGQVSTSNDGGITWVKGSNLPGIIVTVYALNYFGGTFYAGGEVNSGGLHGAIWSSTDNGASWSLQTIGSIGNFTVTSIATGVVSGTNRIVAAELTQGVFTSTSGVSFTGPINPGFVNTSVVLCTGTNWVVSSVFRTSAQTTVRTATSLTAASGSWTLGTTVVASGWTIGLAYSSSFPGTYVMVGADGTNNRAGLWYGTDGLNWSYAADPGPFSAPGNFMKALGWDGSTNFLATDSIHIGKSIDGSHWVDVSPYPAVPDVIPALNYVVTDGNGLWLIGGGNLARGQGCFSNSVICRSTDDGQTFHPVIDVLGLTTSGFVGGLAYNPNNATFAAVGFINPNSWIVESSVDGGQTWTQQAVLPSMTNSGVIKAFIFANNIYMVAGILPNSTPYLATSPDLVTWTVHTVSAGGAEIYCLGFFNGSFYAGGFSSSTGGKLFVSANNGGTWTPVSTPFSFSGVTITSIAVSNSVIIATAVGSSSGGSIYSSDGSTWNLSNLPIGEFFASTFNNVFVTGAGGNAINQTYYVSSDGGQHWASHSPVIIGNVFGLASSTTTFVSCGTVSGSSGIAARSIDFGVTWTQSSITCVEIDVSVISVAATGQAGNLTTKSDATATIISVAAAGQVNNLFIESDATVAITGVAAAGHPGNLSTESNASATIISVAATGHPGNLTTKSDTPTVAIFGIEATGHAGSLAQIVHGSRPIPLINILTFTVGNIWFRMNGEPWNNDPNADPANDIGGFPLTPLAGELCYPTIQGSGDFIWTANFGALPFFATVPVGFTGCPGSVLTGGFTTLDPLKAFGSGNGLSNGNLTVNFSTVPGMVQAVDGYRFGKYYFEMTRGHGDFFNVYGGGGVGKNYVNGGDFNYWIIDGRFNSHDRNGGVNVIGGIPFSGGPYDINGFGATYATNIFGIGPATQVISIAFVPPGKPPSGGFFGQIF